MPATAPLPSVELIVSEMLVGSKQAVQFGDGPVYVSPAMHDLITHAEGDAGLRAILGSIRVRKLPSVDKLPPPPLFR